jgi:hypothetical protein
LFLSFLALVCPSTSCSPELPSFPCSQILVFWEVSQGYRPLLASSAGYHPCAWPILATVRTMRSMDLREKKLGSLLPFIMKVELFLGLKIQLGQALYGFLEEP